MKVLRDNDPMPFGKYERTPMHRVPARYFHWLWSNGKKYEPDCPVHVYIKENLEALKQEHPDGIWS